jgi:hypothetical protein
MQYGMLKFRIQHRRHTLTLPNLTKPRSATRQTRLSRPRHPRLTSRPGRHDCTSRKGRFNTTVAWVATCTLVVRSPRSPRSLCSPLSPSSPRWLPAEALRALCYYVIIQSVPQRKQLFTITKISLLMLLKETVAVHTEYETKKCRLIDCQAGGNDIYHWASKS